MLSRHIPSWHGASRLRRSKRGRWHRVEARTHDDTYSTGWFHPFPGQGLAPRAAVLVLRGALAGPAAPRRRRPPQPRHRVPARAVQLLAGALLQCARAEGLSAVLGAPPAIQHPRRSLDRRLGLPPVPSPNARDALAGLADPPLRPGLDGQAGLLPARARASRNRQPGP